MKISREGVAEIENIQRALREGKGPTYWRSLQELAGSPRFKEILKHEFSKNADSPLDSPDRRRFLQLMGASLAMAGLSACTQQPEERIVPFVRQPEELIPGKHLFFASAFSYQGYAQGVLVESHDGRPTKIEGNPKHPASLGATNLFAQASVLDLYDPDRVQVLTQGGRVSTWPVFIASLTSEMERLRPLEGDGLRILTETVTSPTLVAQMNQLVEMYPKAEWHRYEAVSDDAKREGARLAFGKDVQTTYAFDKASVIVSLDGDFLFQGPGAVRHTKDWSRRRKGDVHGHPMNRLHMAESFPTTTGTMADHRIVVSAKGIEALAYGLARELGLNVPAVSLAQEQVAWLREAAADLRDHRGTSVVVPGAFQSSAVHALAHAMNEVLGNIGSSVILTEAVEGLPVVQRESFRKLVGDIESGRVQTLIILGGNPAFNAPADLDFSQALAKVGFTVYLTQHENETSEVCNWVIPESHYLESWSDLRSCDGTVSIVQPLIEPLYRSKSAHQLAAAMLGQTSLSDFDIVKNQWQESFAGDDFEKWWRRVLHEGLIEGSTLPQTEAPVLLDNLLPGLQKPKAGSEGLSLMFRPDPSIFDGRYANNGWLQELPKALTKLTWDNAALLSPSTAQTLGLENEDVVKLTLSGKSVDAPVWILPGHPENAVTIHLGYGRRKVGRVGSGTGFNANQIRFSNALWHSDGLEMVKTGEKRSLACTQDHSSMEGRDLVRSSTLGESNDHSSPAHGESHTPGPEADLYPGHSYEGHAWGMTVDLNACTGCNACVVACQSENNIPVVGKDQVLNGREMHWIRVDRYYSGAPDVPETYHQPVMCQHCEMAPCESVCPVAATVHSDEGLNEMVYNRCVGTRYCSNNCPYKVRRFNFLLYSDWDTESLKGQRNPNVTVRSRGVMEKCSYCVQRINAAKIGAKLEGREIEDGEIKTACQQVCPADAIVFGDVNDPNSKVSQLKKNQRNYGILEELRTKPRTSYLVKLKNPREEAEAS